MHPFLGLLALATLSCAACAGGIYVQAHGRQSGAIGAITLLGLAYWGATQLFMQLDPDPQRALWFARASAPGWIFLGPLCLQIFLNAIDAREPGPRRGLAGLYAACSAGLVAALFTPWVVEGLVPASWGYSVVPGPLFLPVTGLNLAGAAIGLRASQRAAARYPAGDRRQMRWITIAILVPVALISVTDVWLPLRGIPFPNLAPTAFAPLAVLALGMRVHFGFSPLTPGHVAHEILEILPDGMALLHADGRIRLANQALSRLCGRSAGELQGLPLDTVVDWEPGADRGEVLSASGQTVPVAVTCAALRGGVGNPFGRVLVLRDLREVADLRSRLFTSARLAAVGELAAGIAHEINNPLAFVRSNLSQLEERWKRIQDPGSDGAEARELMRDMDELIEESVEGVDRAVEIVRSVKSFAHAGSADREATDLRPLLKNVLHVASAQLRGRVDVRFEFDEACPLVLGAPQQLRQVFLNLLINATHAVEDGGHIVVGTRADGDFGVVTIADDGCGIPPELMERIFDPFFTTKAVGEGTGLGLGIAHQIVHSHGGEIEVESTPGKGTVFRIRLPAARDE